MRSYLAAGAGAVIGLYAGAVAGALVGGGLSAILMPDAGLEGLAPIVVGGLIGGLAGAGFVCWAALRLVSDAVAGRSALLVLPLLVVLAVGAQVLTRDTVLSPDSVVPALLALAAGPLARLGAGLTRRAI